MRQTNEKMALCVHRKMHRNLSLFHINITEIECVGRIEMKRERRRTENNVTHTYRARDLVALDYVFGVLPRFRGS